MPSRQKEQILGSLVKFYESWDKKDQAAVWSRKLQAQKAAAQKSEQPKSK